MQSLSFVAVLSFACSAYATVASTSYALPTYAPTSLRNANAPFEAGTLNASLTTSSVTDLGNLSDPSTPYTMYRDGGGACLLNNELIWFFCDTEIRGYENEVTAFVSNTAAVAVNPGKTGHVYDINWSDTGGLSHIIPFTSEEALYANDSSSRYALWTYTNCVPTSGARAVHIWEIVKFDSETEYHTAGSTMVTYDLDQSTNVLTITRDAQYLTTEDEYAFGAFSSIRAGDYVYLFALDHTYSSSMDVHLARAPLISVADTSTWEYYDASDSTWSDTKPEMTERRQSSAVISTSEKISSGNIVFSDYHDQYLLVFFNQYADNKARVLTAPSPTGPWTTDNTVMWTSESGSAYNYGILTLPVNYDAGSQVGENLLVGFSYQTDDGAYPKISRLTFSS